MNKPTVSIILCTYNGARFIREQLDSIVAQTYPLLEVIIQDDGSTDDTVAICNESRASDAFIISSSVVKFFSSSGASYQIRHRR